MAHQTSADDQEFRRAFEACETSPSEFDHAAHVRLAYVYLCGNAVDGASEKMKHSLLRFLAHLGVDQSKYHATITRAWVMAVSHFMSTSAPCQSAHAFVQANPVLLDSKIMLTHYSAELLFSPQARQSFVSPDMDAIPEHK